MSSAPAPQSSLPAGSEQASAGIAHPTTNTHAANPSTSQDAQGGQSTAASASAAELASTKVALYGALRRFPDFPIKGINFIDIMPLFLDPKLQEGLLHALELQVLLQFGGARPDVVVGLDARGFLFGPPLALRLGAAFVPVRKQGKLPGPCVTAAYEKEYGADYFQMQDGSIRSGQKVLVVDDIIATGKSPPFPSLCCDSTSLHMQGETDHPVFSLQAAPPMRLVSWSSSSAAI